MTRSSVADADRLVSQVMEARGYPVIDFEERAEIVSVDHPLVVENYRAAHDIATRRAADNPPPKATQSYGALPFTFPRTSL